MGEVTIATELLLAGAVVFAIMFFLSGWRSGRGMW